MEPPEIDEEWMEFIDERGEKNVILTQSEMLEL